MFKVVAQKVTLKCTEHDTLTSGQVNAYDVSFEFSEDWNGLERVASFKAANCGDPISIRLPDSNIVKIPWEICVTKNVGKPIMVGVYGTLGEDLIIPTLWTTLGYLERGAAVGVDPQPATPSQYLELVAETGRLKHHNYLDGRDEPDQHPIEAISGLDQITDLEIDYLWKGVRAYAAKVRRT